MPVFSLVGSPQAIQGANGGKVRVINNVGTSPFGVAGISAQRVSITFHNPGQTNIIYVAPLTDITGATVTPSLSALGGCFAVLPGGFLVITGECQVGWQVFASAGVNNPVTVMESNI